MIHRQLHGNFAAEGMADDPGPSQAAPGHKFCHIGSQAGIIHECRMRTMAMIAQVGGKDVKSFRQTGGDPQPVVAGAE